MDENNKILDLGCGKKKVPGAIGIDYKPTPGVDVVHDLNVFPYPFNNSQFDIVYIRDTLFLLNDPVRVMEEVYRVCRPGGEVVVVQPYFRSVWGHVDPRFKSFGTVHSFALYDPNDEICKRYEYSQAKFLTKKITFNDGQRCRWLTGLVTKFANRYPKQYELYVSHYYPLDTIKHELKKV